MSLFAETFLNPQKIFDQIDIKQDMKIADFGCGSGYLDFILAKMVGAKGQVICIDVQKLILKHIERKKKFENISNIKTVWANLEIFGSTKIKSQTIDLVLLVNTLYQCQKYKEILKETYRILQPSGELLIIDWQQKAVPFGPPITERIKYQKIFDIAVSLGLNKIKKINVGKYHFGVLFKK